MRTERQHIQSNPVSITEKVISIQREHNFMHLMLRLYTIRYFKLYNIYTIQQRTNEQHNDIMSSQVTHNTARDCRRRKSDVEHGMTNRETDNTSNSTTCFPCVHGTPTAHHTTQMIQQISNTDSTEVPPYWSCHSRETYSQNC